MPDHDDTTGGAGERREEERAGELRALSVRVARLMGWSRVDEHDGMRLNRLYWIAPGMISTPKPGEEGCRVLTLGGICDAPPRFAEDDAESLAVLRAGVERFGAHMTCTVYPGGVGFPEFFAQFGWKRPKSKTSYATFAEAVCRAFVAACDAEEGGAGEEGAEAS